MFKSDNSSGSWKETFSSYGSYGIILVPYDLLPAENFLNSIMLHVRVPVLSENTYSIYPSSSFKLLDYAFISVPVSSSNMLIS